MLPDFHIVFGDSAAGSLKMVLREQGAVEYQDKVICFSDIFSIAPVWRLQENVGQQRRLDWLMRRLSHEPTDRFDDWYRTSFQNTLRKITCINDTSSIAIWGGDNAHEQTGLRFVLHLLRGRTNCISSINITKAFRERYGKMDPLHSGEIVTDKMKALIQDTSLFVPINNTLRNQYEREWLMLSESEAELRIWKDEQIYSVEEDYFDERFIQAAQKIHKERGAVDFIKAARLVGEVYGHLDQYVGDQFLEYRLRQLIDNGTFVMEGSLEAMRFYNVKLIGRILQ